MQKQDRLSTERIQKIKIEINHRLSETEEKLDYYLNSIRDNSLINELAKALSPAIRAAGVGLVGGSTIYPEFENRTVKSLLIEWQAIASKEQIKDPTELIRIIEKIERHDYPSKEPVGDEKASVIKMLKALIKDAKLRLFNQSN